jgi:hypothetical protein
MKQEIIDEVKALDVTAIPPGDISLFCKLWPSAKEVLLLIIKIYPAAGWAVKIIIAIGDTLSGRICSTPPPKS